MMGGQKRKDEYFPKCQIVLNNIPFIKNPMMPRRLCSRNRCAVNEWLKMQPGFRDNSTLFAYW